MYVKKFEGESLTETLNLVKKELGPDAIILKTVTNKGIKGAFKKSKIEITAAISEESYAKKSKVDRVLSDDQKNDFYSNPAKEINTTINTYNKNNSKVRENMNGYGNIGLNKVVNTVSKASEKIMSSLDDFLSNEPQPQTNIVNEAFASSRQEESYYDEDDLSYDNIKEIPAHQTIMDYELKNELQIQKNKIESLERKIEQLVNELDRKESSLVSDENIGLAELKVILKTADLSDKLIQDICKKALFDLSKNELNNREIVFEHALGSLSEMIQVEMPLFSSPKTSSAPVVTALVSDSAIGQSSMAIKLAVLNKNARVIKFRTQDLEADKTDFAAKIFNINYFQTNSLPTMLSEIRKAISSGDSVILDIKTQGQDLDSSKKILETLKRSFEFIEVLITTSAINSELYNRKILAKYKDFSDGVIISYVDQCMSFGSLLNMHYANLDLPLKFFGTGQTVPDDIEAATAERILAAMFKL